MVVADFNVKSVAIFKSETNAPLIVNRYCMLSFTIICEFVQLISGWHFQIIKTGRKIDIFQLS